ncbi:MAG: hypothetical protein HY975_00660 [Candidatus Kerfeldbacteria bacterium]|nr:hypothetical protein [Candidatus Kerfeldbacteria bacterium]
MTLNITASHRHLLRIGGLFCLAAWGLILLGFWLITDQRFAPLWASSAGAILAYFGTVLMPLIYLTPPMTALLLVSRWVDRWTWTNVLWRLPIAAVGMSLAWMISTLGASSLNWGIFVGYVQQLLAEPASYIIAFGWAIFGFFMDWFFFTRHFTPSKLPNTLNPS